MRTEKDLINFANKAREVLVQFGLHADENIPVVLNNRLTRALGVCHYVYSYETFTKKATKIELQKAFYCCETVADNDILSTLIHEYLHAVFPYDNHGGKWKYYADLITANTEYKITIYSEPEGFDPYIMANKYELYCPKCGLVLRKYKKKTGMCAHPQNYMHRSCQTLLAVRTIPSKEIAPAAPVSASKEKTRLEKPIQLQFDF